jgi:hypothetical protein
MSKTSDYEVLRAFVKGRNSELQELGLFFLRLLQADLQSSGKEPSPVFVATAGALSSVDIAGLCKELNETSLSLLHDRFGFSILRQRF